MSSIPGNIINVGKDLVPGGLQGPTGSPGATGPGSGDMLRATYDANNDGVVDLAASVPFSGITSVPPGVTIPPGVLLDYAGNSAPAGFLLCDGASYAQSTYAALYAALGGASSPWGVSGGNFNVPDLRSRVTVGAGSGLGMTSRVVAARGGEETHVLVTAELASHAHTIFITDPGHNHGQNSHAHSISDGGHAHTGGNHQHLITSHSHYISDPGHSHTYIYAFGPGGGSASNALPVPYQAITQNTGASGTGISVPSSPAFWSDADVGGRGGVGTSASGTGIGIFGIVATNIAAGTSISSTAGNTGSGSGHNTMPPFAVVTKIVKT
jgi:microcystin-dependent protein